MIWEEPWELINAHRIDVTTMLAGLEPLEKLSEILSSPQLRAKGKYIILPNGERSVTPFDFHTAGVL